MTMVGRIDFIVLIRVKHLLALFVYQKILHILNFMVDVIGFEIVCVFFFGFTLCIKHVNGCYSATFMKVYLKMPL